MSLNIEAVFGENVYRFDIPDNQSIDLLTRKFSAEFFKSSLEKEGIFVNENFITKFIGMLSGKTRNKINPNKWMKLGFKEEDIEKCNEIVSRNSFLKYKDFTFTFVYKTLSGKTLKKSILNYYMTIGEQLIRHVSNHVVLKVEQVEGLHDAINEDWTKHKKIEDKISNQYPHLTFKDFDEIFRENQKKFARKYRNNPNISLRGASYGIFNGILYIDYEVSDDPNFAFAMVKCMSKVNKMRPWHIRIDDYVRKHNINRYISKRLRKSAKFMYKIISFNSIYSECVHPELEKQDYFKKLMSELNQKKKSVTSHC